MLHIRVIMLGPSRTWRRYCLPNRRQMSEFPPYEFPWDLWLCPGVFIALAMLIAGMLMRRSVQGTTRTLGFIAIGGVTFWFFLMLPKFQGAREAGPRTQCRNNLKQIARAVHSYHDEHGVLPSPSVADGHGRPVTWRIDLLPLVEPAAQASSSNDYDRTRPWDDAANLPTATRRPVPFVCPSNRRKARDVSGRWFSAYAFVTGLGTPFPPDGPLTLDDITDGTADTLLLVEACGQNIVWTEPRDVDVSKQALKINAAADEAGSSNGVLSSYHEAGAHCAMVDGSARFLSDRISEDVLRALATAAAEDEPGEF